MRATRRYWLYVSMISIAILGTVSCGSFHKSPSEVVKSVYAACNDGKYSEAEKYLSKDMTALVHGSLGASQGGMKRACDESTRDGKMTRVEILSERIRGDGATVMARIHFQDGSTKEEDKTELVKEEGAWKINN